MMILLDSSFVVEWLSGSTRSKFFNQHHKKNLYILDNQYCEVITFFQKRGIEKKEILTQLEGLILEHPEKKDLSLASTLYLAARQNGSKASLSDAILAAVARRSKQSLLTFDHDFAYLGFKEQEEGFWVYALDQ